MAVDIASLEPQIWRILSAPDTDLNTVSAKRVRRQLLEYEPSLSAFVKENKEAVDAAIARVFDMVSGGEARSRSEVVEEDPADEFAEARSGKRKRESEEGEGFEKEDDPDQPASPSPKKKKKATKRSGRELSDAEIARQLSNEINSRSRRNVSGRARGAIGSPRKGKKTKSSALVDSEDDEGWEGDGKKGKVAKTGGTAKGGFAKEYMLSEALAAVVGVDKLSRPQVVKHLWRYIKTNELQNPQNKKEILCDGNLKAVFHVDRVDSFKMNKVLSQHLHES